DRGSALGRDPRAERPLLLLPERQARPRGPSLSEPTLVRPHRAPRPLTRHRPLLRTQPNTRLALPHSPSPTLLPPWRVRLVPAGPDLLELGVHLRLERHVRGVAGVEPVEPGPLPLYVRGHSGPDAGQAIHVARSRPASPGSPPRMRVPVDVRVEAEEPVAEQPGRPARHERVLAPPAAPVSRVVRVEEHEPA